MPRSSRTGRVGAALGALVLFGSSAHGQSHLMRQADVHEDRIVFVYEGDLWIVPSSGGAAERLTRDDGMEAFPKFSPDGAWIAFTGEYDGGTDVYAIPATGGIPRRLTFHPASDRVLDWFPDGKHVLFRSDREYPRRCEEIYRVPLEGGMEERLNVDCAGLTALSPDGLSIAYNRTSQEGATWKRYQGGTQQDIWMGRLDKADYRRITDWPGNDNFPMWQGDAIFFTSDRENGTLNLFRYDVATKKTTALTKYTDYDVKFPSIGPGRIVYQYAESLYLLDLASGQSKAVPVTLDSDRTPTRAEWVKIQAKAGAFGLSPKGKRMLLSVRGEVLNLPVEDGEPINLTNTSDTREKNATWSPDGRWVAFLSDRSGEEELYLVDQRGEQPWRAVTSGNQGFRLQSVWSPDSRWLMFGDKALRLSLADAESGTITQIDQGEYDDGWGRWGIQDYVWSPDSQWVAYTKLQESLNEAIFLYSLREKKSYRVTDGMTEDWSPSFDPKGRYLYFLSHRTFKPVMGFVEQSYVFLDMARPYLVVLKDGEPSPFAPKDSSEELSGNESKPEDSPKEPGGAGSDAKKEDASEARESKDRPEAMTQPEQRKKTDGEESANGEKKAGGDKGKPDSVKATVVDVEGIARRVVAVEGVPAGNYFRLEATSKGFHYLKKNENEFEKYQTVTDDTEGELDLYHYDLEKKEPHKVMSGIANYHQSADGKKLVYRAGRRYGVVDVGKDAKVGDGEVKLDGVRILVDRSKEYLQIFNEAWRVQRDWFYDPNLHGVDWKSTGAKYRQYVSECGNRHDLNYLIGEMIGELNAGHTYVSGGDTPEEPERIGVGLLGIRVEPVPGEAYYRIRHIYPGTPGVEDERSPLMEPGCPIRVGDYLIAIDGVEVPVGANLYEFLVNKRNRTVTLTYNTQPVKDGAKTYRVKTIGGEGALQYREWVDRNRALVDKASKGLIGYVHIPDMGAPGLVEFGKIFFAHHYKKGFIIDVRYNSGGFTADMLIDRLERRVWSLTKPREGKPINVPERTFYGHWVVLINENTGSSGELFSEAVKRMGLAPLIGVRTWGGSVGIEPHQLLIDGGTCTPPQFGAYGLDRTWPIEGHGVDPDIEVENLPGDVLQGRDAQLETGIQNILQRLRDDPKDLPPPPAYPDKRKKVKP